MVKREMHFATPKSAPLHTLHTDAGGTYSITSHGKIRTNAVFPRKSSKLAMPKAGQENQTRMIHFIRPSPAELRPSPKSSWKCWSKSTRGEVRTSSATPTEFHSQLEKASKDQWWHVVIAWYLCPFQSNRLRTSVALVASPVALLDGY